MKQHKIEYFSPYVLIFYPRVWLLNIPPAACEKTSEFLQRSWESFVTKNSPTSKRNAIHDNDKREQHLTSSKSRSETRSRFIFRRPDGSTVCSKYKVCHITGGNRFLPLLLITPVRCLQDLLGVIFLCAALAI